MKNSVIRTAVIAAAITTVLVTAITLFAVPKVPSPTPVDPVLRTSNTPQPVYEPDPYKPSAGRVVLPSDVRDNSVEAGTEMPAQVAVGRHRSTGKSVAIIAGSAGTGAAIGAIAKGGKGAAIGALVGGAAGLLYDRLTADQQTPASDQAAQPRAVRTTRR